MFHNCMFVLSQAARYVMGWRCAMGCNPTADDWRRSLTTGSTVEDLQKKITPWHLAVAREPEVQPCAVDSDWSGEPLRPAATWTVSRFLSPIGLSRQGVVIGLPNRDSNNFVTN